MVKNNSNSLKKLNIKIFYDTADITLIKKNKNNSLCSGFTTNPTLVRQAKITNYYKFCKSLSKLNINKPISIEVIADDLHEMEVQAKKISKLSKNFIIKIPITNTKGDLTTGVIHNLTKLSIPCNITAVFNLNQVDQIIKNVKNKCPTIISIFAGRIADTGIDPEIIIKKSVNKVKKYKNIDILWASPREILNIYQANKCGCNIITINSSLIDKLSNIGKNLDQFSIETVKMFYKDAIKSKYKL
ncbi:transaldolase [Pelagibacteraceae bacterium]|nr:transaldolase [Pelagibacteraceae bacterium]